MWEVVLPMLRELHEYRVALAGVVLLAAGEDIDAAIERLEAVQELDPQKDFKKGKARDLAVRVGKLAEQSVSDLKKLKEVAANG